jgi:hypothetical protein
MEESSERGAGGDRVRRAVAIPGAKTTSLTPDWFRRVFLLPAVTFLLWPAAVFAEEPRAITSLVPADCLVMYAAKPYASLVATSQPAAGATQPAEQSPALSIASILVFLNASGLIPDEGQVFADVAAALPLLGEFEHAFVLLDVSSRIVPATTQPGGEDEVSLRLKDMQAAVVFRTDGRQRLVLEQINRIVGRYTNEKVGELEVVESGSPTHQRLRDDRLPGWAVWEWGRFDDFFVVSFGAGAFERIAQTYMGKELSLADDPWFKSNHVETHGDRAAARAYVALSLLEQRLAQVAQRRHTQVIRALGAENIDKDLWTIGQEDRAITWYRCYRKKGEDVHRRYSDPESSLARHLRIIPPRAGRYGIIHVPTRWLVDNLPRAWVAARSESHVRAWNKVWSNLEKEVGVDIRGGLIEHLRETIVIFDYPPHPLRIPFALTIAIEIDDRKAVQMASDTLLAAWSKYLDQRAEQTGRKLLRAKVCHDADGVWFVQAGILGPAMKVTDGYIVLSWSPQALRDALRFIEARD